MQQTGGGIEGAAGDGIEGAAGDGIEGPAGGGIEGVAGGGIEGAAGGGIEGAPDHCSVSARGRLESGHQPSSAGSSTRERERTRTDQSIDLIS